MPRPPVPAAARLTDQQVAALDTLERYRPAGASTGVIADRIGTGPQGAARTLASLARRGLAERHVVAGRLRANGRRLVTWRITGAGTATLTDPLIAPNGDLR